MNIVLANRIITILAKIIDKYVNTDSPEGLEALDLLNDLKKIREGIVPEKHKRFEPHVLVKHIDSFASNLNDWEIQFISNLIDNPPDIYSSKQLYHINRIYDNKC